MNLLSLVLNGLIITLLQAEKLFLGLISAAFITSSLQIPFF